ncbi:DUF1175 family protein (plasmid) [Limosilactobacillus reuteri]|uniref:DUF1175 family protein n=2 Tax=Limosilactobacillus reuteri TaxID=1598 RepID=A0A517D8D7_LIMRT|nr:DUF1175 family protein [Limosilactobacillus reuteri]
MGGSTAGTAVAANASTVTVNSGDTVSKIAKDNGVTTDSIIKANNLDSKGTIKVNQQLKITDVPDTYTVQKGDTVSEVAQNYDLDTDKVLELNNLSWDNSTILVGQTLQLKDNSNADASNQSSQQAQVTPSTQTQSNTATTAKPVGDTVSQKAVSLALQYSQMNIPYVWGGTSTSGFDCSGLTQYIYNQLGVHLNRTAAAQVSNTTTKSVSQAQPGDLLFWQNASEGVYHVAIYIGNNQYVAAPTEGQNVQVQTISQYFAPSFAGSVNY